MSEKRQSFLTRKFADIRLGLLLQIAVGVMFVIVGAIIVVLVRQHMREQALAEAESKARMLLDRNLATHTYFSHQLKPHLFEWTEPFTDEDYFDPVWMSSTYAVRETDKYFRSLNPADYYYKEAAINARTPANEADAFERQFLEQLNADPELTELSLVRTLDGQPYFVTLRRGETMEESCLRCHSTPQVAPGGLVEEYGAERSFSREVGDVVSAISIRVPLADAYGEANRFAGRLSLLLLALLVGLFAAQFWLGQRLFFAPVDRVREKALQIAEGANQLGEQIPLPRGAELRELTSAFNKMSQALRRSHDDLEKRVAERTADLRASEERFRELFDSMSSGVAVYEARDEGKDFVLADLNRAGERLSQVAKDDVVGRSVLAVFPGVREMGLFDVFQQVWRSGEPAHHPAALYEDQRISHWVENYVYKLPSGEVVAVYDDITERKQAEEERQRLLEKLRAGRQQLEALSRRLVEVQEAERSQIAYELHEQILQSLTMAKIVLDQGASLGDGFVKEKLDEALALVQDVGLRMRDLSFDLRPPPLSDLGLLPALEWLRQRHAELNDVRVTLEHSGLEERRFAPEVETTAYRVVQAALDNVARHAGVDEATVRAHADDHRLSLEIQDEGVGFDPETAFVVSDPRSLAGMRERVSWLGGQLTVESAPGAGTRVAAEFPFIT